MGHTDSTRRHARLTLQAGALALLAALTSGAQAEGLTLRTPEATSASRSTAEYALTNLRTPINSIHLFGEYYFFDPAPSELGPVLGSLVGGLRASTGVVGLAQPLSLYETRPDPLQSLPYVGLGYSHFYLHSQLSLNADFGLASQTHGHGLFSSSSSLDDVTSQLRWAPIMAVNVRYAF